jgi:hypothetical protein
VVAGGQASAAIPERRLPPITELCVASMIFVVTGGILLAAYLPDSAPLGVAAGLLAMAAVMLAAAVFTVSRLNDFAWKRFFVVARWAVLAYIVIAGMLEYVFVVDGTRGGTLAVLSLMLAIFSVDIPLLFAFSVARYADTQG